MKGGRSGSADLTEYPINPEAFTFLSRASEAVYDFTYSEPISGAPAQVMAALQSTIDYSEARTGKSEGDEVLQKCVEIYSRHGIECSESNIALSNSILHTITDAYESCKIGRGDTVLVAAPTFGYYIKQLQLKGIDFQVIPTRKENDFLIDPSVLEDALVRYNAKVLLMCNPNNPTGSIMTQEAAQRIAEVVRRHDVFVISDEAFLELQLSEDKKHFPFYIAAPERTLMVSSMSKTMGLPLHISFCVGPEDTIRYIKGVNLSGQSNLAKDVLLAAIDNTEENQAYLATNRKKYADNTQLLKEKVSELNQKFCTIFNEGKHGSEAYVKPYIEDPSATNLYLLDFSGLQGKNYKNKELTTGLDISEWLLQESSVGVVPGECSLFPPEDMLVRIAIGCKPDKIIKAFDKVITTALNISNAPTRSVSPVVTQTAPVLPSTTRGTNTK